MKFVKIDTNLSTTASKTPNASKTHGNDTTDDSGGIDGYMYLDEMLDKTFITDYFLQ
jgi:hypothetical protein